MTHNPPDFPPVEQWPLLAAPDCPTCQRPTDVAWIGPATLATGAEVNVWRCRACPADFSIPAVSWPVNDGPDCPHCGTELTCWAALAPDALGDLWTCEYGHEFILTAEGLVILPEGRCMTRPPFLLPERPWNGLRILDLFAGAGGAGMGFWLAGFAVTAVDIRRQARNPFPFIQADALEVLADRDFVEGFDAVHGSPICQSFAAVTDWRGSRQDYPDLLTPTLALLADYDLPWIVENVVEAARFGPLRADHVLCGTQFGLNVRRHRAFQTGNWDFFDLVEPCRCHRNRDLVPFGHKHERAFADAMGCTWMTNLEARQAIPPAYTHWLGNALTAHLNARRAAA